MVTGVQTQEVNLHLVHGESLLKHFKVKDMFFVRTVSLPLLTPGYSATPELMQKYKKKNSS